MATKGRGPRPSRPRLGPPRPPKKSVRVGTGGSPGSAPIPAPKAPEFQFGLENLTLAGRNAQKGDNVDAAGLGDHRSRITVSGPRARPYGEVPEPPRTQMHDYGGSFSGKVVRVLREGEKVEVVVRMRGE